MLQLPQIGRALEYRGNRLGRRRALDLPREILEQDQEGTHLRRGARGGRLLGKEPEPLA